MSVRMRRPSRPAPRSCVRMLFPGTVRRPRFLPPFRVLSPRHRRYDVDHTSSRCEGQVLRRGVLLGGAVQGRAGGVTSEHVDQVAHGGGGSRGYRGYQGSRRLSHRLRPLPRRRLAHPEPGPPPPGAARGAAPRGTAPPPPRPGRRPRPGARGPPPPPAPPPGAGGGRPDPCVRAPRPTGARPGAVCRGTAGAGPPARRRAVGEGCPWTRSEGCGHTRVRWSGSMALS